MSKPSYLTIMGIRGRVGYSSPLLVPDDLCTEALNVEFWQTSLARRINGSVTVATAGGTGFGPLRSLFRFLPGEDQTLAETWAIDNAGLTKRAASTTWANVSYDDAISDNYQHVTAVTLNGKLYLAYNSTVNRLHVYDPADAKVRRVGLQTPAAPTVADFGSGSYTATVRYYKVAYVTASGGNTLRRSNLSPSVTFTPGGSGDRARVTKPAAISEGENAWAVYGSADNGSFFRISSFIGTGTTTFDDINPPSSYSTITGEVPPDAGAFTPPPSAKYLTADDTRIIMAGSWETSTGTGAPPSTRRVWWSSRLGATDLGDDERVSLTTTIKSYSDVGEAITGLSPVIDGTFLVFSHKAHWRFTQTGDINNPYTWIKVTGGDGCLEHKTIVTGEDEQGQPCIYWISERGPVRYGRNGLQYLGEDISDYWVQANLDATTIVGHSVYYPLKHQVWFFISVSGFSPSSNFPIVALIFDCRLGRPDDNGRVRGGWTIRSNNSSKAVCSCLGPASFGASAVSTALKPYVGGSANDGSGTYTDGRVLMRCDESGTITEDGVRVSGYLATKYFAPWGLGRKGQFQQEVLAISDTVTTNSLLALTTLGSDKSSSQTTLTIPAGSVAAGLFIFSQFDAAVQPAEMEALSVSIGDDATMEMSAWNIHAVTLVWTDNGDR